MSTFTRGNTYLVDYGIVTKLATFLHSENGEHTFFDNNGQFTFTDAFIKKGKVTITEVQED